MVVYIIYFGSLLYILDPTLKPTRRFTKMYKCTKIYTLEAFHLVTRLLFKDMEFLVGTFFYKSFGEMTWTQMIKNKKIAVFRNT